jgi:hypothetical protein
MGASFEKLAPKSGAMTEAEATDWANVLHRASDEGVFSAPVITTPILQDDLRVAVTKR